MNKEFVELLNLDNETFVKEVYKRILNRDADENGFNNYLTHLNKGMSKERVIFDLRTSEEGLKANTLVEGLKLKEIDANSLLRYDDEQFVAASYLAILGRPVDIEGLNSVLKSLSENKRTKAEIIKELLQSPEGQNNGIKVKGLGLALRKEKIKNYISPKKIITKNETPMDSETVLKLQKRIRELENEVNDVTKKNIFYKEMVISEGTAELYEAYKNESYEEVESEVLDIILNNIVAEEGNVILDLYSGSGCWLSKLEKYEAIGIEKINILKENHLSIVNADPFVFLNNAFGDNYDAITIINKYNYLSKNYRKLLIKEVYRCLKKNGQLLVCVNNDDKNKMLYEIKDTFENTRDIEIDKKYSLIIGVK